MVFANESASIRSLTSLKLVSPPKNSHGANDDDINGELGKWDPFPAPYAPGHEHLGPHRQLNEEARDEQQPCHRSTSDGARDGPETMAREVQIRKTHKAKPPRASRTPPPRIPQPRPAHGTAAYYSSEKRSRSRTSSNSSGRTELIKITANGSVTEERKSRPPSRSRARPCLSPLRQLQQTSNNAAAAPSPNSRRPSSKKKQRQRSFSPILTRGRVDMHLRTRCENDKIVDSPSTPRKNRGTINGGKGVRPSSSKPDEQQANQATSSPTPKPNSTCNPKIFMLGMAKVYSRTLIPPTVYHNAVTDLWIVTINSNSKLANPSANFTDAVGNDNNSVKAFSFRTEKEARASAYANAPPIMIPFDAYQECMLCETKFTLFKRPRHCRNCGICICSSYDCCTVWLKKMIPETFNIKNENTVKVCTSCNELTKRFRHALLEGRYGSAVEIYLSGNINLRVPFAFRGQTRGKESMFPIHCAIEGQSEKLVRWLVDVQHCPIHVLSTGNATKSSGGGVISAGADMIKSLGSSISNESRHGFVPTIKTSKGRSVMDVAMKTQHVGILRYLINEKNVSVYEVEDLELALGSMEALVRAFPVVDGSYDPAIHMDKKQSENDSGKIGSGGGNNEVVRKRDCGDGRGDRKPNAATSPAKNAKANQRSNTAGVSPRKERIYSHSVVAPPEKGKVLLPRDVHGVRTEVGLYGAIGGYDGNDDDSDRCHGKDYDEEEHDTTILLEDDNSVSTTVPDTCILCREKDVDCVATPCGHQMCCLTCSNQCLRCPICNLECHFIEIYQP